LEKNEGDIKMGKLVISLLAFGLGLLGFGFYYKLFEDITTIYFQKYIINNLYFQMSDLVWDMLPYLVIIIGILCLIGAGLIHRGERRIVYE
jgi:hypothetical protein